jgi:hypothetical protein
MNTAALRIDELQRRASAVGLSMARLCREAKVAHSSVWRAKQPGGDMRMATFDKLDQVVAQREASASAQAE